MKKAGELTEDSQKTMEEDVQKLTDKYIKNIDAAVEEKQKEIMSVRLRRCNKLEVPCAEEECAALLLKAALLPGGNNGAS